VTEVLPIAIGLGLVVSLLLSELLGVASAGMVVPGYVALYLGSPMHVLSTLLAAGFTYLAVRLAGRFVILYGRRRTALAILLGYLSGAGCAFLVARYAPGVEPGADPVVGYIIPGLIAIWMDRQGVLGTLLALTISSSIVRLVLILLLGAELPGVEGLE
jgi:poly-gamma-glutamate biosynthesis protein PgsC/CapC